MKLSDLPLRPPDRMLRQFAALWLVSFTVAAAWQYFARNNMGLAAVFGGLAATIGPLGLVKPAALRPIFVTWIIVAFPIGWCISTVLLTAVYYGVFTPLGLAFRIAGRDALQLRRRSDRDSYWMVKPAVTDARRYFRQF